MDDEVAELLSRDDLPDGFDYPREFVRVIELGLTDLEPWHMLQGDLLYRRYTGLQERYKDRRLVPFARRQDNDDVACWDLGGGSGEVVVVHDFATPGAEQRVTFANFNDWLRQAIEDFIAFE